MPIIDLYASVHAYSSNITSLKGGTMSLPLSMFGYGAAGAASTTGIAEGLCSDFGVQIDNIVGTFRDVQGALNDPFSQLRGGLNGLVGQAASPIGDVNSGMDTLGGAIDDTIPPIPDVSEIEHLLQECGFLKGSLLGGLQSPAAILNRYLNQLTDLLTSVISAVLNGLLSLIEAPIALILNLINKILNAFDLGDLLSIFDGLINCIEAICGRNFNLPSTPKINSSTFPTVQGYPAVFSISGFPDVTKMVNTAAFKPHFDNITDLVNNKLPNPLSFQSIKVPNFPIVEKIPGYPYITDMLQVPEFKTVYNNLKQIVNNNIVGDLVDDIQGILKIPEYPGVEEIPGYPNIADMVQEPEFKKSYDEAINLAQVDQNPYIEYMDNVINYVNNMLTDLNLTDDGEFDFDAAIADVPDLSEEMIESLNTINGSIAYMIGQATIELAQVGEALESGMKEILTTESEVETQKSIPSFFA